MKAYKIYDKKNDKYLQGNGGKSIWTTRGQARCVLNYMFGVDSGKKGKLYGEIDIDNYVIHEFDLVLVGDGRWGE